MVEQSFDRTLQQAILGLKKGAYLLKCGRRGKPKFHPFRLSTNEKCLIWYSRQQEKQLRLCSVKTIITGQQTENFQRQLQPDKQNQSFSLIYGANGERSLDLICKDKAQADSWFIALSAVISRFHHSKSFTALKSQRAAQSCVSSPAGYFRRKHNLGIQEDDTELAQARSLCGSPTQSCSERCFSDALSVSSNSFSLSESSFLHMQNSVEIKGSNSPYIETNTKKSASSYAFPECEKDASLRYITPAYGSPKIGKTDVLKDVLIWGEGVGGGNIGGAKQKFGHHNGTQFDSLMPKLLEATAMLDVESICLGAKRAALITKRGELFSWGEGSGGKLGHKANIDVNYPKIVESLDGLHIKSVACGEYQTCALTDSGEMYAWGDNIYGANAVNEVRTRSQWFPYKISGPLDGITILKVACGEWHTAILSASGQLYTYGDGTFGALGHGDSRSIFQPKEVESLKGLCVKTVACGTWHTAAIVDVMADRFKYNAVGGKLFTWGDGDKGRLGHIDPGKKLVPTCIASVVEFDFVRVSCGRMLTVALTNTGMVYTMGSSVHGQLGNPQAKDKSITIVEGKLKEEYVKDISAGAYHVAALTYSGRVYTWGKGANGQLGLGSVEDRNSPTFVEALRDRQVESIACGSNLTAAICLYKSISGTDQSSCSGCRMLFGLTRKKHNCYNCGLLFCHTCSSKKVVNASLAPDKSKRSRVCDLCFSNLQKDKLSGRLLKIENYGSSQQLLSSNEKECSAEANLMAYNLDIQVSNKKSPKNQGENLQHLEAAASSFSAVLPKWGQVPCPAVFESYHGENNVTLVEARSSDSSVGNIDERVLELNNMLTEEVQRLRAEAKNLETQCELGSQKIRECQETMEKAWSLAREEATKRQAANDIIKVLSLRLHAMSEKISAGRDSKGSQNAPSISTDIINHVTPRPPLVSHDAPPQVKLPKERHLDSLLSSPIVFSNTLKTMQGRGWCHDNGRSEDDSCTPKTDCRQQVTIGSRLEWVEQYEPGVYITLTVLSDGQKGLKRVRFSRKRFLDKEAQRWWEENQGGVYHKYGIDGYANTSQNPGKS